MNNTDRALLGAGLLIPVWLLLGVSLTSLGYPGYSHLDQAMSQLGRWAPRLMRIPRG